MQWLASEEHLCLQGWMPAISSSILTGIPSKMTEGEKWNWVQDESMWASFYFKTGWTPCFLIKAMQTPLMTIFTVALSQLSMALGHYEIQYVKPLQTLRETGTLWCHVKNLMESPCPKALGLEKSKTKCKLSSLTSVPFLPSPQEPSWHGPPG